MANVFVAIIVYQRLLDLCYFRNSSSVAVSAWTLVVISVERYYAICYPLRSRRWQTLSHAYKMIAIIWCTSLIIMLPIAVLSKLLPTSYGHHKCREAWPTQLKSFEKGFNLFLDVILLILPLLMLGATFTLITKTLCKGMRDERDSNSNTNTVHKYESCNNSLEVYINSQGQTSSRCANNSGACQNQKLRFHQSTLPHLNSSATASRPPWYQSRNNWSQESSSTIPSGSLRTGHSSHALAQQSPGLRRSNAEKILLNKKRVVKMLFTVVLEFFVCWTPLYAINTIALFKPSMIYQDLGYTGISFLQLLAYSSSCCNPITYCFMSCGFRKAFRNLFHCCQNGRKNNKKKKMKENESSIGGDSTRHHRNRSLGYQHSTRMDGNGGTRNLNKSVNSAAGCSSIVKSRSEPNNSSMDCEPINKHNVISENICT